MRWPASWPLQSPVIQYGCIVEQKIMPTTVYTCLKLSISITTICMPHKGPSTLLLKFGCACMPHAAPTMQPVYFKTMYPPCTLKHSQPTAMYTLTRTCMLSIALRRVLVSTADGHDVRCWHSLPLSGSGRVSQGHSLHTGCHQNFASPLAELLQIELSPVVFVVCQPARLQLASVTAGVPVMDFLTQAPRTEAVAATLRQCQCHRRCRLGRQCCCNRTLHAMLTASAASRLF
jgi:hypothetical protein